MTGEDLSNFSMRDLFRIEAENQVQALTAGLLDLEKDPLGADQAEACMRAAHSLKGAARIVELQPGVTIAHAMEDLFVAAQEGRVLLDRARIDLLLRGVDLLDRLAKSPDLADESGDVVWQAEADLLAGTLERSAAGADVTALVPAIPAAPLWDAAAEAEPEPAAAAQPAPAVPAERADDRQSAARMARVSTENLDRLVGYAGEALVETRWLRPFAQSLQRLKRMQREAAKALDALQASLPPDMADSRAWAALTEAQDRVRECRQHLSDGIGALDEWDNKTSALAHRLHGQALKVRMRPFADGTALYPRMVRDVAHMLGKQVRLEIMGGGTQIDRDIFEKLDAPLGHLLRNAVDHGIESPDERIAAGKPPEGLIRVEAFHSAGLLQIVVSDDGRGIDQDRIRAAVIGRGLATAETAARLRLDELLEFLFLPGFTMKDDVTQVSGRGVGLDVVQDMARQVRGRVRVGDQPGGGTRFTLELPLTLSVVRALIVEIGGEPYAFPFAQIVRAIKLPRSDVRLLEGRQYFEFDGQQIGLVSGRQLLGQGDATHQSDDVAVVILGHGANIYGLLVERFLGGRELVVQPLDPHLGKIKDISAAALLEDGSPVLIVDIEDMIHSVEKLASGNSLAGTGDRDGAVEGGGRKRVLVVDDSFTVRELQRKLLDSYGYAVDVAVDGMDAWNALRNDAYDLVVSDIDMPRMDGIELVGRIRQDPRMGSLPVMILSYKDREEDRQRGLDAGADYYLTKGSFQSDALVKAVTDLIGEAAA